MPDRIKFESTAVEEDDDSIIFPDCCSSGGADCCSQSEDLGVESMADDQSVDFEFNFEEACQRQFKRKFVNFKSESFKEQLAEFN